MESGQEHITVEYQVFLYFFAFLFRYFPSPPLIFPGCHSMDMSQNELTYVIHMETGMSEKMAKHQH